jgi:hypothetical protein
MTIPLRSLLAALFALSVAGCDCQDSEPGDTAALRDDDDDGYIALDDGGDDCDDGDATVYPGAPEICDGQDDDCDGLVDEDVTGAAGALCDGDGDGFLGADDCDDTNPAISPDATEDCNGIDDDCDGEIDEDTDGNGDGQPDCLDGDGDGWSPEEGDCDDTNADFAPDATEFCDGIDNDCDGAVDEDTDQDADGTPDCDDLCPVYVDLAAAHDPADGTFTHPHRWIQDGIETAIAQSCDTVLVSAGVYEELIDFLGADLNVIATGGRGVTVIDGLELGTVVTVTSGEVAAKIQGFTIRGGSAELGGAFNVVDSSIHILDNEIVGNEAYFCTSHACGVGGGIRLLRSESVVEGNLIQDNDAGWSGPEDGSDGGGIAVIFGAPEVFDNTIVGNLAGDGGGLWLAKADALIYNNIFAGNEALDGGSAGERDGGQGGGVNIQSASAGLEFSNNLVWDNEADVIGGGVCVYEYNPTYGNGLLANNTIAWNSVGPDGIGAGLALWVNVAPDLRGNLIFGNTGEGVHVHATALANSYGTTTTFAWNLVAGHSTNWAGAQTTPPATTISAAPTFVGASDDGDWSNDDFHLQAGSAGVDAGDPDVEWNDDDGTRNDVGAYGGPEGGW